MASMDCEKNLGGQEEVLQAGQWSRRDISAHRRNGDGKKLFNEKNSKHYKLREH